MSKRMSFIVVTALAFTALCLLPFSAHAATVRAPRHAQLTTAYYAFAGLITKGVAKDPALNGSLKLVVGDAGKFVGEYRMADESLLAVKGQEKSDGSISIFFLKNKTSFIKAQGTLNANKQYTGTFQMFKQNNLAGSGIWSTFAITPKGITTISFESLLKFGPHANTQVTGVLVLDSKTLAGLMVEPNGALLAAHATLLPKTQKVKLELDNGNIIGVGKLISKPAKGFTGTLNGPDKTDKGIWEGFYFN